MCTDDGYISFYMWKINEDYDVVDGRSCGKKSQQTPQKLI
jgi:hypothetical protein